MGRSVVLHRFSDLWDFWLVVVTIDSAWTAFANTLPATIAATAALIGTLFNLWQSVRNGQKADLAAAVAAEAKERADKTATTTEVIRSNTDGNLSQLRNEIQIQRQEIESLKTAREVAAVKVALETPVPQGK